MSTYPRSTSIRAGRRSRSTTPHPSARTCRTDLLASRVAARDAARQASIAGDSASADSAALESARAAHLLDGPPEDHTLSDTRAAIIRHVRRHPSSTPKAIAEGTGLSYENVRKTCQRMNADGQLCVNATGHYRLPGTPLGDVPGVPPVHAHTTTSTNAPTHEGQPDLLPVPAVHADEEPHQ